MGTLEVICGPMFSGKSTELIRRLEASRIATTRVLAVKHGCDDARVLGQIGIRITIDGENKLVGGFPAHSIETKEELENLMEKSKKWPDILVIDEAQFFGDWLVEYLADLLEPKHESNDCMVIVAGLDMDYRRQPFGPMPRLMAMADTVLKLRAVCNHCKKYPGNAIFTQKLKGSENQIEVGDKGVYEARCRDCHYIY